MTMRKKLLRSWLDTSRSFKRSSNGHLQLIETQQQIGLKDSDKRWWDYSELVKTHSAHCRLICSTLRILATTTSSVGIHYCNRCKMSATFILPLAGESAGDVECLRRIFWSCYILKT
ncbi:hypothetical protein OCU04_007386 [Sclerotinia nivalis]|uniref:Uncharacterized protein n=1 Tax=Sclerotinia nivalis TaxID=352851 RepID=A0A9X0DHA3_9HELO|nr:hypothetical protein OCU04_007386 [Sclerotinia nivalis]